MVRAASSPGASVTPIAAAQAGATRDGSSIGLRSTYQTCWSVRGSEADGEPGLARTRRTGERQRAVPLEEVSQPGELGVPADQR